MELKLTVVQGQDLIANHSSVVVDADVYSIGRGADNSWVLPDPKMHISNKHCVIHRKHNEYHLTDISTNGVYLNDSAEPLGRGRSQILKQGDHIQVGEFALQVSIEGQDGASEPSFGTPNHQQLDQGAVIHDALQVSAQLDENASPLSSALRDVLKDTQAQQEQESQAAINDVMQNRTQPDVGAGPTMSELLRPIAPEKAYYVPPKVVSEASAEPLSETPSAELSTAEPANQAIPDNWLDIVNGQEGQDVEEPPQTNEPAQSVTSPRLAEPSQTLQQPDMPQQPSEPYVVPQAPRQQAPKQTGDSRSANENSEILSLIIQEAGLPEHLLQGKDRVELARQMGRMMKQFAQGAVDTLATRSMVKSEFRLHQTMIRPADNNPLKLSPSGEEALKVMLMADSSAYLTAENAIQEGFKDIQAHQLAMMSGIQAAFTHLLQRFEPQKLEQKFDNRPRYNKGLLARNKTDHWREYQDYYQDICAMMEDEFQDLFSNEFGKAYETQLRKIR